MKRIIYRLRTPTDFYYPQPTLLSPDPPPSCPFFICRVTYAYHDSLYTLYTRDEEACGHVELWVPLSKRTDWETTTQTVSPHLAHRRGLSLDYVKPCALPHPLNCFLSPPSADGRTDAVAQRQLQPPAPEPAPRSCGSIARRCGGGGGRRCRRPKRERCRFGSRRRRFFCGGAGACDAPRPQT